MGRGLASLACFRVFVYSVRNVQSTAYKSSDNVYVYGCMRADSSPLEEGEGGKDLMISVGASSTNLDKAGDGSIEATPVLSEQA